MAKEPDAKSFIESIAGEFASINERLDKIEKKIPDPSTNPPKEEPKKQEPKTFWESLFGS